MIRAGAEWHRPFFIGNGTDVNLLTINRPYCHLDRSGEIPRQARDDRGGVREEK